MSDLTLGERALAMALSELGTKEIPAGSNSGPRVREYLGGCVRGDDSPVPLHLVASNWCMAFQSWCCYQALRPGEHAPHGWRAGVVEAVADAQDHSTRWTGRFKPVGLVRAGEFTPDVGDLAIYDRSTPGRPETSWWRHVNRVAEMHGDWFEAVGGNESDEVRMSRQKVDNPQLLGFIAYPGLAAPEPREILSAPERDQLLGMVALSLDGIVRDSIVRS
jgi:hypothetical protein